MKIELEIANRNPSTFAEYMGQQAVLVQRVADMTGWSFEQAARAVSPQYSKLVKHPANRKPNEVS